jgi:hypothetical protein
MAKSSADKPWLMSVAGLFCRPAGFLARGRFDGTVEREGWTEGAVGCERWTVRCLDVSENEVDGAVERQGVVCLLQMEGS